MSTFTAAIVDAVEQLSATDFVARTHGYFLVVAEDIDDLPTGFRTDVVEFVAPQRPVVPVRFQVLPVRKTDSNPFASRISIGRARNCDVVIRHASISKLHAHVVKTDNGFELTDASSTNGVWVNGEKIAPGKPVRINVGDTISLGELAALFVDAPQLYERLSHG